MAKGIFITATGTGIGKTFVSGLLVKKLRGYNCGYYKPVLSGLEEEGFNDCEYVCKTAQLEVNPTDCLTYGFKPAVSPHLAAQMSDVEISLDNIKKDFERIKQNYDYLVVEGAGGILCPFRMDSKRVLLYDLIKVLGLDIIIVADAGLGTINSAILTYEFAKNAGIKVQGFILNNYDEDDFMHSDNKRCIEELSGVKVIATVALNDKKLNIEDKYLMSLFKEI